MWPIRRLPSARFQRETLSHRKQGLLGSSVPNPVLTGRWTLEGQGVKGHGAVGGVVREVIEGEELEVELVEGVELEVELVMMEVQ